MAVQLRNRESRMHGACRPLQLPVVKEKKTVRLARACLDEISRLRRCQCLPDEPFDLRDVVHSDDSSGSAGLLAIHHVPQVDKLENQIASAIRSLRPLNTVKVDGPVS